MMDFPPRSTRLAQQIVGELLREGDVAIDATAGNGHDTQFLAGCVGTSVCLSVCVSVCLMVKME